MRLLYLYPEEWTGRRAREVHTLSTCVALVHNGVDVVLVTAGGEARLRHHIIDIAGPGPLPGLQIAVLSRALGPIRSAGIFASRFRPWIRSQPRFDIAYIIHPKAAPMLSGADVPFVYEAHEIFAESPQKSPARQARLEANERQVLTTARFSVATSSALAVALTTRYNLDRPFTILPNAGLPPLDKIASAADGPFVYGGSIADWKGLDLIIPASRAANVPLKIVGGTAPEWKKLGEHLDLTGIAWQPRVPLADLPAALTGSRAGLIPTQPETGPGRYSCPMKLFDYARCGLPVVTTALPSLDSLATGSWCRQVSMPTLEAWTDALRNFCYTDSDAETARFWAAEHTWNRRAELLIEAIRERR
ncbi:MAG: glycosyltransferase [Methylacidiphilales bacterium]|nr:glycosyltransferase [Candidatus Methylacidiphilales bacterium]